MSTCNTRGSKHLSERDRSLANALRRESIQLDRTLRTLGHQHQRDLAGVCGAQSELRRALDKLEGPYGGQGGLSKNSTTATAPASNSTPGTLKPRGPVVMTYPKHCCPNHIVCSTCNLRLRLADAVTRQFTPSLWTMYSRPLSTAGQGAAGVVYRMPGFMERRNLSASDNSIRYLPFL